MLLKQPHVPSQGQPGPAVTRGRVTRPRLLEGPIANRRSGLSRQVGAARRRVVVGNVELESVIVRKMRQQRKSVDERKIGVEIKRRRAWIGALDRARQLRQQREQTRIHIVAIEHAIEPVTGREGSVQCSGTWQWDTTTASGKSRHHDSSGRRIEADEDDRVHSCSPPSPQGRRKEEATDKPRENDYDAADL